VGQILANKIMTRMCNGGILFVAENLAKKRVEIRTLAYSRRTRCKSIYAIGSCAKLWLEMDQWETPRCAEPFAGSPI